MADVSLVIGDCHTDPSQLKNDGLRRFRWLNKLIFDKAPNRIIIMGDFTSFSSLSAWDKDKRRKIEGRRYEKDIDAANQALDYLLKGTQDINDLDQPDLIFLKGNHEEWLDRYIDIDPTFDGLHSVEKDMKLFERGFKVIKYKEDYIHKGMSFTHVPIMANGKPVGGKYATNKALEVYSNSVCFGHTHNFDVAAVHRKNSTSLQQAINCGCFFEHIDEYAQGSMTNYWRGVLLLDHYDTNRADIEQWSMGRLKRVYGK